MAEPGRSCPLSYQTRPEALNAPAQVRAETLYVVGGLYGNVQALRRILGMVAEEVDAGLPRPELVFNGDFNWFNAEPSLFREINSAVLAHRATLGNVELELVDPTDGAGCGCGYPPWVDQVTVDRSNRIMERLQPVARSCQALLSCLGRLPMHLRANVGGLGVAIIHGDPESVAGWGLALESMPPAGVGCDRITEWFRRANVDVFACTHTCTAYVQDFLIDGRRLVLNNGAAGMPNFSGDPRGHITRISCVPPPFETAYSVILHGMHCASVPVSWDSDVWLRQFDGVWPAGSPAAASYRHRLVSGPDHSVDRACRLSRR